MNLKNFVMGIAILVLTIFVAIYGIGTFYSEPNYDDFCGQFKTQEVIESSEQCAGVGGSWVAYENGELKPVEINSNGWCDRDFECRQEYETARETYSRNLFLMALPLGIILIAIGIFVFGLETVGAGLGGGGVGIVLWGVGSYWQYGSDLMKFLLSLIGLVIVIGFAYWFNKKDKKKKRFGVF